jgi:HAD superfamily hydrolase (TIGR01509 family)
LQKHHRPIDSQSFDRLLRAKSLGMYEMIGAGLSPALPGVLEFVRGLAGYPLAICSGALRPEIEMMLDGIQLREHFPVIVSAEDVAVGKPDPSGYLQTIRILSERAGRSITPADTLVVEDAPNVIESVRRAGFKVLGVATTFGVEALGHADYVVTSLQPAEVLEKIPGLQLQARSRK